MKTDIIKNSAIIIGNPEVKESVNKVSATEKSKKIFSIADMWNFQRNRRIIRARRIWS
ncbi:MAG: hypothetical protein KF829_06795 [Ferruginibacter sp.]|nr:hypothetical protein [Ferruginibacter sp.]